MRSIVYRNRCNRDIKRIKKRGWDIEKFYATVGLLIEGSALPPQFKAHKLAGEYAGLWECHIESDWLLVYDSTDDEVILSRTGTHVDLFE